MYYPERYQAQLAHYGQQIGLQRTWAAPTTAGADTATESTVTTLPRRGLARLHVRSVGKDFAGALTAFNAETQHLPCLQLDICMDDKHIDKAVQRAEGSGFVFCAWLPGFTHTDVLRLQKVDPAQTDLDPIVVNPTAQGLLAQLQEQLR